MSEPRLESLSREQARLAGTTALGMAWAGTAVYALLNGLTGFSLQQVCLCMGIAAVVFVSWALVDRKRWARLAMLGIAGVICADFAGAAVQLALAARPEADYLLQRSSIAQRVLSSYGSGAVFGGIVAALCFCTFVWLTRDCVRLEFNLRKRAGTMRWQVGIAAAMVLIVGAGVYVTGAAREVSLALRDTSARLAKGSIPVAGTNDVALKSRDRDGRR